MVYIIMVLWCVIGDGLYYHGVLFVMVFIIMVLLCVLACFGTFWTSIFNF